MHVDIILNIISLNLKTGEFYYIEDNGLPYIKYEDSLIGACSDIIRRYTEIDPEWIEFNLLNIEDGLKIYYFCLIPDKIKLKRGTWTKVEDYELIQEIQKVI